MRFKSQFALKRAATAALFVLGGCNSTPKGTTLFTFSSENAVEHAFVDLCVPAVQQGKPVTDLIRETAPMRNVAASADPADRRDDHTEVSVSGGAEGCDVIVLYGDGPELLDAALQGLRGRPEPWEAAIIGGETRSPQTVRTLVCTPSVETPEIGVLLTTVREGVGNASYPALRATVLRTRECALSPLG